MKNEEKNIQNKYWSLEDEREHLKSVLEWWCSISFFETENKEKYSFKITFTQWNMKNRVGSILHSALHNLTNKKNYSNYLRNEKEKLKSKGNLLDISFQNSNLSGKYPNYTIITEDKKNKIKLKLNIKAEAIPHQISQDISNGNLPLGLGCMRYGFIPKCKISGELTIKDKKQKIKGQGYYEHVWGNFDYEKPLSGIKDIKTNFETYLKLAFWWMNNKKIRLPLSIKFATENNPLGYDWAWIQFDNGWSIFYGNILLWLMEGPGAAMLILTKDGKKYSLFCDMEFKYIKTRKSKMLDFEYPSELEIIAKKGKEKLSLNLKMIAETREYSSKFLKKGYWQGFIICEAPGIATGVYTIGQEKTKLKGICKIEPQRQISILGHNTFGIKLIIPPNGIGISINFESNYFEKKGHLNLQIFPKLKSKFLFKRI